MGKHQMTFPENLCLAPFAYLTFDPAKNVSPCPALGGSVWNFKNQSLQKIWSNDELTAFRNHMLQNNKHEVCHRCWNEEKYGMTSERTKLWNPTNDPSGNNTEILTSGKTASAVLDPNNYKKGPMQLIIKVGNVCNLRCRSCNSADSVTLSVEGKYYAETHGWQSNFYLKETEAKVFSDQQIDEIISFADNVVRIEFYGGEPLLDKQLPRLLQKLVDRGYAERISLNISTNCTHQMDETLIDILSKFHHLNVNLSMDGWGNKFTYLRHPGRWEQVYKNVQWFIALRDSDRINMSLLTAITVTSMNVFDLPELITNVHTEFALPVFLILAWYPRYYSVNNIPKSAAEEIAQKLEAFQLHDLSAIVEALRSPGNEKHWTEFKKWTRMVDEYRNESFSNTFPEYVNLLKKHDKEFDI